jgi:hypothetical protein
VFSPIIHQPLVFFPCEGIRQALVGLADAELIIDEVVFPLGLRGNFFPLMGLAIGEQSPGLDSFRFLCDFELSRRCIRRKAGNVGRPDA